MSRIGVIQKELLAWISASEYTFIAETSIPPQGIHLDKHSMDEVRSALKRLLQRKLIIEIKPGFYALPGWEKPDTEEGMKALYTRQKLGLEALKKRLKD